MVRFLVHLVRMLLQLYPPPSLHLPALEETKPATPPHLLPYLLELEKTKLVTPLHFPLYANSTVTTAVTFPVLELEKTKQKVAMEKTKLATPPHLRPKLRQPAPSVPLLGQASPSMIHQSLVQPQQPGTDLSTPLLRTRKIMISHRLPGRYWSCPRSRRRWRSRFLLPSMSRYLPSPPRSRSCLLRRSRCILSPRSRFLSASRSRLLLPPSPLMSRFCCCQGQGPAAAFTTEAKVTTVIRSRFLPVAKVKVTLLPPSMRSKHLMSSRLRFLLSSRSRLLLPSRSKSCCCQDQDPAAAVTW